MSSGAVAPVAPPTGPLPTTSIFSIERVVVLASPLFLAAAAWLSGLVAANIPWAPPISPTGLAGVMIAMTLAVAAAIIKWLHGRQIPAIAALSPIKVNEHTLDAFYAQIEAYLAANASTFQGVKGDPGLTTAEIEQLVASIVAKEVTSRLSAAAGSGSLTTGATGAPGITPA